MAQAHSLHIGVALHVAGEHGHGVGVVQEQGVGADRFHVFGKIPQHGDGAQRTHDAADSQGVADGLAQTVFLGNLEIRHRAGLVQAHLDGVHHEVGAPEGLPAVLHAQISLDDGAVLVGIFVDCAEDDLRFLQALGVDVIQCDLALAQSGRAHAVPQYIPGKHRAASSHKCDFRHVLSFRRRDGGLCDSG